MSLVIHQGLMDIVEPDGARSDYERFIITRNPGGTATMRTVTRSPAGDLLRDVNHLDAPDWRPIEAMGRLFFKGEAMGTVLRRLIGDKMHSWVWHGDSDMDYQVFDAPPKMTVGFHPIQHEAWKMNFIERNDSKEFQPLLTHTVSNTWNGRSLSHGMKLESKVRYDGMEKVTVPAGTFDCERFTWATPFDKELHIWCHGPERFLVKETVARGDKEGTVYELVAYEKKVVE
ncbi:MAG: hypothetical protein O3C65_14520 [Proteobacteria bacterium]|nr:hypothetical protein [Pseudomonadota bacterium]MDA1059888.1 hypothetical protein [Pseudomonadota bacterium]